MQNTKAKNLKTCHDRCPASVYPNRCQACFEISKEKKYEEKRKEI